MTNIIICLIFGILYLISMIGVVIYVKKGKSEPQNVQSLQVQIDSNNKMLMDSLNNSLTATNNTINNLALYEQQQLENIKNNLANITDRNETRIAKLTADVNNNLNNIRQENAKQLSNNLMNTQNAISNISTLQKQELDNVQRKVDELTQKNELKIEKLTNEITNSMTLIREENEKKLEQMRLTVDEKLNVSLSQRLNDSFAKIQSSLEFVNTGLGEMKALANGVGDLKKMLSNVKTRGVWGEVMLSTLLEQMLSKNQFKEQVEIKPNSKERVDFVVVMPGKDDKNVYLPIDSKFPLEDYYKLSEASEGSNIDEIEKYRKALSRRIKEEAKKISEKYIDVPTTTDFAVMFLPIEGLYAEVVKDTELIETIQNNYKIVVCGPTTFTALLNSLQLGFKTMYIQKRSSEIWNMLSTFKQEFEKFAMLLAKTQNKIQDANDTIEQATKSSQKIAKKLNNVSHDMGIDDSEVELLDEENN